MRSLDEILDSLSNVELECVLDGGCAHVTVKLKGDEDFQHAYVDDLGVYLTDPNHLGYIRPALVAVISRPY